MESFANFLCFWMLSSDSMKNTIYTNKFHWYSVLFRSIQFMIVSVFQGDLIYNNLTQKLNYIFIIIFNKKILIEKCFTSSIYHNIFIKWRKNNQRNNDITNMSTIINCFIQGRYVIIIQLPKLRKIKHGEMKTLRQLFLGVSHIIY